MAGGLSFRPLAPDLLGDWRTAAEACPWAHVKALDEGYLRLLLSSGSAAACVVLYDGGRPAGVFSAEPAGLPGRLPGRAVRAEYGGLFLAEAALPRAGEFGAFLRRDVFRGYFRRELGAHLVRVILPPTVSVLAPRWADAALPGGPVRTLPNTLLYADLKGDVLAALGKGARYEARRGLKALEAGTVRSGPELLDALCALETAKAARLGSAPVPRPHLARVLASPLYRSLAAFADGAPQAAVIYSLCGRVATFHFNASTERGQQSFLNKGLLARALAESRAAGAEVFVLGDGRPAGGQLGQVTAFKRSFATGEADGPEWLYPLSVAGRLVAAAAALRRG